MIGENFHFVDNVSFAENYYHGTTNPETENYYHGTTNPETTNHFNDILMNDTHYNLIEDPQSDYEAIDTSLFGWWKAKLRKSQIRKV